MDKFVKRIPRKHLEQTSESNSISTSNEVSMQNDKISRKNLAETAFNSDTETELQCLEFASPLLSGDYRLVEVSPSLADRIIAGEQLVIRGELEDSPVLCTHDTTFDVKEVVTSNALLLLPEFNFSDEANANKGIKTIRKVIGMKNNFIELRQMTFASVQRLKEKLHESELEWDEEFNRNDKFFTVGDLLDVVQMSEVELQKALERLPVITLNGYVRMLSAEFHDRLVTAFVDCLDDDEEPGIILESVGLECLKEALKKYLPDKNIPVEAVNWLIEKYCNVVKENGTVTYHINEKAICRAKISQLLRAAVKFEYDTFEKALQQLLPIGVEFKEEYLEGLAFIDEELTTGKTIRYLNIEDLPEEPIKRLELLFSLRQSWKESIIQQYLSDLCPTKRHLNELLVNCCRQKTTVNGEKVLVGLKEMLL
ncbi:Uncharacterized protein BM_BM4964 [Brugia malayi]|uniref:Sister chromatid cohesion protein DCC1 n=1 Tax=Brugia malayi TaxID=6279 RepID=A0A4E9FSY9_BRUMA|nr:Uncharacterized protein BM_BM4964 [Brugia malayi]VIO99778.1 Uncharacterized protein BM_BM4964 [Brugia malayi]